jgi:hypothetical protein
MPRLSSDKEAAEVRLIPGKVPPHLAAPIR